MWSLGILLYTLVFFENPFHNVDETIAAELEPPWDVSEGSSDSDSWYKVYLYRFVGLYNLLSWLLHPSPIYRATIKEVERHWWVTQPVEIDRYRFSDVVPLRGTIGQKIFIEFVRNGQKIFRWPRSKSIEKSYGFNRFKVIDGPNVACGSH